LLKNAENGFEKVEEVGEEIAEVCVKSLRLLGADKGDVENFEKYL